MPRSSRSLWTQKILSGSVDAVPARKRSAAFPSPREPYAGFVLGIDPSLRGSGFAVVEFAPRDEPRLHFSRTLRLPRDLSLADCLVALEETIYVNNYKVAQTLGAARGAAIAAAAVLGRKVFEYPPLRIKQAVVGFGRAQKSQVAGMTKQILRLAKELPFDESDAAAAALCHGYTFRD